MKFPVIVFNCLRRLVRCDLSAVPHFPAGRSLRREPRLQENSPEGGLRLLLRIMAMRRINKGEMWFIDTQHRFTGMAADSFVGFNYDDRWSELVSFVFNAWTHDIGFCEKLAGKIGFVVVWLWRITVRVESRRCHGDFSCYLLNLKIFDAAKVLGLRKAWKLYKTEFLWTSLPNQSSKVKLYKISFHFFPADHLLRENFIQRLTTEWNAFWCPASIVADPPGRSEKLKASLAWIGSDSAADQRLVWECDCAVGRWPRKATFSLSCKRIWEIN